MKLIWSDHALQRVAERFGFSADIPIPGLSILKASEKTSIGSEFRIHHGRVCYVLKRVPDGVLVVTVFWRKGAKRG